MDSAAELGVRWFAALLVMVGGVLLIMRPQYLTSAPVLLRQAQLGRVSRNDGDKEASAHLDRVIQARAEIESAISTVPVIAAGVVAVVVGAAMFASWIQLGVGSALVLLPIALALSTVYVGSRVVHLRRAAVLAQRPVKGVPTLWFVVGLLVAAVPLVYLSMPEMRFNAVTVTLCALITIGAAVLISYTPTLLRGDDLSTERFVDDRLRAVRARALLGIACIEVYLFVGTIQGHTRAQLLAKFAVDVIVVIFLFQNLRKPRAEPNGYDG